MIVGVRDLDGAVESFVQAYGWKEPAFEENAGLDATFASFPEAPVILASPVSQSSALAKRLQRFGECPAAFLFRAKRGALRKTFLSFDHRVEWIASEAGTFPGLGWIES